MNDFKWTGKEIISFLNIFQNYPCLWDAQSNNYFNRDVKDVSLHKLLEDLRVAKIPGTPDLIKNKIINLRNTYRKKFNEVQTSKSGADKVFKQKLVWFSAAEVFCHGSFTSMESSLNLDLQLCSTPEDEQDSANDAEPEKDFEHLTVDEPLKNLVESSQFVFTTPALPTKKRPLSKMLPPQPAKCLIRQSRDKQPPSRFKKTVNKLQQIAELIPANSEDQYDTFSKHLASQLRELPIKSFIFLQSKIQNLITEERIANLNSSTFPPQSKGVDMSGQKSTTFQNFDTTCCESENTSNKTSDTSCYTDEEEVPHMNILNKALFNICKNPNNMDL